MEGDYTDDPGVVIRNLKPEDFSRLVAIDEKITGRSRQLATEVRVSGQSSSASTSRGRQKRTSYRSSQSWQACTRWILRHLMPVFWLISGVRPRPHPQVGGTTASITKPSNSSFLITRSARPSSCSCSRNDLKKLWV